MTERRCEARGVVLPGLNARIWCVGGFRGPGVLVEVGVQMAPGATILARIRMVLGSTKAATVGAMASGELLVRGEGKDVGMGGSYISWNGSVRDGSKVVLPMWVPFESGTRYLLVAMRNSSAGLCNVLLWGVVQLPERERVQRVHVVGGSVGILDGGGK